ncbi:MAG: hypothetical protein LJF04_01620 [Gemmatimonadetes bacterium]|nr:hypothetical protein [Gemmatimonadota bacterium]
MGPVVPIFAQTRAEAGGALALPGARFTPRPVEFEQIVAGTLLGVVVCPPPDEAPEIYAWLLALTVSMPAAAIVCLTRFDEEWLAPLARVSCAAIVSIDHADRMLEERVARLRRPDIARVLHQLYVGARVLGRPCAAALRAMCHPTRKPIVEVASLPRIAAASTSAFYEAWPLDFPHCSPKRVADWIAIAKARQHTRSAQAAARFLGVHPRSYDRMWVRCLGQPMSSTLDAAGVARFVTELSACAGEVLRRAMERRRTA